MSPGRRRVSADQTRTLLVDAALERIETNGVAVNLDSVSLEEMVRHAEVPRSSAYAAWQQLADEGQTPQAVFRREVLRRALIGGGERARDNRPMIDAIAAVLAQRSDVDMVALATEMIRSATESQFDHARRRQGYRTSQALAAAATSVPDEQIDREVLGWLRDAEGAYIDTMIASFQGFAEMVEIAPAPELDGPWFWHQFATAAVALGEGLFTRVYTSEREVLFDIKLGEGEEAADWTLFGIGMQALYDRFFVPAPKAGDC